MHKGYRILIKFLLLELHTYDLLRNLPYSYCIMEFMSHFALFTWHNRDYVSATLPTFFMVMILSLQESKNIGWACA